jgi:maleamate amidohydrolase
MPAWDDVIPHEDRAALEGEWGRPRGIGARPALLVVDMNNAFVDDRFPLGCASGPACAQAIAPLIAAARESGVPVIYSTGKPAANPAERGLWKSTGRAPDPGLGDPHEIVPELAPQPGESVIAKRRPSAFFGTELASLLTYHGTDSVVLCGMVTSGCIRATAVDAFSHNLRVIVPEECVADRARVPHAVALFDIHMKYGDVIPAAEALAALERASGAVAA